MIYKETYRDLSHGTDEDSARVIKEMGFELRGSLDSWCGKGVYFYDIKKKAWWAAKRKCYEISRQTGKKVNPMVIFVDIIDIEEDDIFDLRSNKDLRDFEKVIQEIFGDYNLRIKGVEDTTERIIKIRSMMISYYADKYNKKLIIGNFRQRPQPLYEHAIEFSNSLDMIFGIETIYCVKDIAIIKNVH